MSLPGEEEIELHQLYICVFFDDLSKILQSFFVDVVELIWKSVISHLLG